MPNMRSRKLVMLIVAVAFVAAVLAIHFFGGPLMSSLRAMHGAR
jgi:hypothetical protein